MPATQQRTGNRILIAAGALLILVLAGFLLQQLASILQPLFIALVLVYIIRPATRFMVTYKVPQVLALPAVIVVVLSLTVLFGWFVQTNVATFRDKMPEYQERINAKRDSAIDAISRIQRRAMQVGLASKPVSSELKRKLDDLEDELQELVEAAQPLTADQLARLQELDEDIDRLAGRQKETFSRRLNDQLEGLREFISGLTVNTKVEEAALLRMDQLFSTIEEFEQREQERSSEELKARLVDRLKEVFDLQAATNFAVSGAGTVVGWMGTMVLVFVYLMFLLAEAARFPRRIRRAYPPERAEAVLQVTGHINNNIFQYISVKVAASLLTALLSLGALTIFDVDFKTLWALLLFLFNFVPYIGSFVACMLPILTAWLTFESGWSVLGLAISLVAVQIVVSQIVEPKMAGRRLDISPVVVLTVVIIWGWLWGVLGMVLAVPVVAAIKIVMTNVPATRPIAALIGDIPPEDEPAEQEAKKAKPKPAAASDAKPAGSQPFTSGRPME